MGKARRDVRGKQQQAGTRMGACERARLDVQQQRPVAVWCSGN